MIHDDMTPRDIETRRAVVALEAAAEKLVSTEEGAAEFFKIVMPLFRARPDLLPPADHHIHEMLKRWDPVNEVLLEEPWGGVTPEPGE